MYWTGLQGGALMEQGKKKPIFLFVFLGVYALFIFSSFIMDYEPGKIFFDNY